MAHEHPDWSGLQAVDGETPLKEATRIEHEKELSPRQPFDHYQQDKYVRHSSADKHVVPAYDHNHKILGSDGRVNGVGVEEKQLQDASSAGSPPQSPNDQQAVAARKRSRRRLYILVGLVVLIVALAVAIPCGVVLSQKANANTAAALPGSTSTPAPPHNGTRLATLEPSVGGDKLWIFWQNANGDIRLSKLSSNSSWQDSVSVPPKQTPALGSPFAACVHYTQNLQTGLHHLVYFTTDGYYADLVNDPTKDTTWSDGGLYKLLRAGPHDPHFHMAWGVRANGTAYLYEGGARSGLWNTFTYDANIQTWSSDQHVFLDTSSFGGIAVQQGDLLSTMRVVMPNSTVVSYYRDTSAGSNGRWVHDTQHILDQVHANSSLAAPHINGDSTLLYYQAANNSIGLAQVASLNANAPWKSRSDLNIPAMPSSSLQVSVTHTGTTYLILQENGNDLTYYTGSAADLTKQGTLPL